MSNFINNHGSNGNKKIETRYDVWHGDNQVSVSRLGVRAAVKIDTLEVVTVAMRWENSDSCFETPLIFGCLLVIYREILLKIGEKWYFCLQS